MQDLKRAILECRAALRLHRDARGDERCWLDDYYVWNMVEGSPSIPTILPLFDEGMNQCRTYYRFRNAPVPDPMPAGAVTDPARWDDDLEEMTPPQLTQELERLHAAVRRHRDVTGRPRTADDDRALYAVLPEKLPADFRLPPEDDFLGEAKAPRAGCPSFWRSHAACPGNCHDLHRWGPCGMK